MKKNIEDDANRYHSDVNPLSLVRKFVKIGINSSTFAPH
jgi:hypothetical protein